MSLLLCPYDASTIPLRDVPDPVLRGGLLGVSVALDPDHLPGAALSPGSGTVQTLHPHAVIVRPADGPAVLLHLGVDTVRLRGAGFRSLIAAGDEIAAGAPAIEWDPGYLVTQGYSPVIVVALLDTPPGELPVRPGSYRAGEALPLATD